MSCILGIESSCDETAAAVVRDGTTVLSNAIASQHDLHAKFGGVVPEIASRAHIERILPIMEQALEEAEVSLDEITAVAVGNRPGLIGSLLVGVAAAKTLAWTLGKPLLAVDHVQAHLYAGSLDAPPIAYPALGLVVSGGHTSLYDVQSPLEMFLIGRTIDDAVGEAYDKVAAMLDLGFPGGPAVDRLAATGNPKAYRFPRSMLERDSLDFSLSGLKTAVLYEVRGKPIGRGKDARFAREAADLSPQEKADVTASFQAAVMDTVFKKIDRAIAHLTESGSPPKSLLIGGGVSANSALRKRATLLGEQTGMDVRVPPMAYCLDNAAMIAGMGHVLLEAGIEADFALEAVATTSLTTRSG